MAVFVQGVFVTLSPFTPLLYVEYIGYIQLNRYMVKRIRFALQMPDFIFNGGCFVQSRSLFFKNEMSRQIIVYDRFVILNIILVSIYI